jgi:hypothetical protein
MDRVRIPAAIIVVLGAVASYTVAGLLIGRDRDYLIKADFVFIFGLLCSAVLILWGMWTESQIRKRRRVHQGYVITCTSHYEHAQGNQPAGWVPSAAIQRGALHWTVRNGEATVDSMELADLIADHLAAESIRYRKATEGNR